MKNATGKFLTDRGDVARLVQAQRQFDPNAQCNRCIENSLRYTRKHLDAGPVFGWCIGDFVVGRGTAIIPHCWVRDAQGRDIDITPVPANARDNFDYVTDFDVFDLFLDDQIWLYPLRLTPALGYQVRIAADEYVDVWDVKLSTLKQYAARPLEFT